jgi:hypothetical protein
MSLKNLLDKRIYIFPESSNLFESDDNSLYEEIFKKSKFKYTDIDSIEFVNSNYNYDTYKIKIKNNFYILKYTLDESSNLLKKESNFLKKNKLILFPDFIEYDKINYGDNIQYSITECIQTESMNHLGTSLMLENIKVFFADFNELSSLNFKCNNFYYYINQHLKKIDFNKIPQDSIESISNQYDINIIKNLIYEIKLEIINNSKSDSFCQNDFCHGNLKLSNIFNCKDYFRFSNLDNYFIGNRYLDFSNLAIECCLNIDLEKDLFKQYLDVKKMTFSVSEWESYKKCYNIIIRKYFLDLLIKYFYEVFVLNRTRPIKIYNIIKLITKNIDNFLKIPSVRNNYSLINDIISKSIFSAKDE